MRNLKKVLSLVLVFAMACTMMAGAAFNDQKNIVNADAVNMLSSLNVIKGATDGNFNPEKTVTRAEMAKMIYVIKNAGNDDGATYYKGALAGANGKPVFSDTVGHWAQGYINWAYSLNIVTGRGNGKFDPDASVTGLEAAKMLLTVLGYKPATEGMTGNTWAIKTAALASEGGLFANYTVALGQAAPRDFAALMIYNALDSKTVVYRDGVATTKNVLDADNQTLGKKTMNLDTYEGVLVSAGTYAPIGGTGTKDKIVLNVKKENGVDKTTTGKVFDYKADAAAQVGQYVKVTVSNPTNKESKVYGVYTVTEKNTVVVAIRDDVDTVSGDSAKVKVDGTEYKINGTTATALVYGAGADTTITTLVNNKSDESGTVTNRGDKVTFIDNDDDDKFDYVIVTPVKVGKVTYVGKDTYTIENVKSSIKLEDSNVYTGMAKDDYVVFVDKTNTYDDKYAITKADVVEGKITSTKGSDVKIGDKWYAIDPKATGVNSATLDSTVKLVTVGGIAYIVDQVTLGTADFAMVEKYAEKTGLDHGDYEAKIILSDGTEKVVNVKDGTLNGFATGDLVSYTIESGDYKLTKIDTNNKKGYDAFATLNSYEKQKFFNGTTAYYVDKNSIVFAKYTDGSNSVKYKMLSGSDILNWADGAKTLTGSALMKNSDGFSYAKIVAFDMGANNLPGGSTATYGFLTDGVSTSKNSSGSTITIVPIWNGKEKVELKYDGTLTGLGKKDIIEYTLKSDGYADITNRTPSGFFAVTGYSASSNAIEISELNAALGTKTGVSNTYTIKKDTVILYVNSDKKSGVDGGSILVADQPTTGTYKANVRFYEDNDSDKIELIVIDVNNEWKF